MHFLITNDDGYSAIGIKKLVEAASKFGKCTVVAPKVEQSAKSHAINVKTEMEFYQAEDILPGVKTYVLDSTPADCVRVAYNYLKLDFDIVLSGVNNGFNLGEDIIYSGTCAAATEGMINMKKSIALSARYNTVDKLTDEIEYALDYIFKNNLLNEWDCYNVNMPIGAKTVKFSKQGKTNYISLFEYDGANIKALGVSDKQYDTDIDTDVYLTMNGNITITPLSLDRTQKDIYNKLKKNS